MTRWRRGRMRTPHGRFVEPPARIAVSRRGSASSPASASRWAITSASAITSGPPPARAMRAIARRSSARSGDAIRPAACSTIPGRAITWMLVAPSDCSWPRRRSMTVVSSNGNAAVGPSSNAVVASSTASGVAGGAGGGGAGLAIDPWALKILRRVSLAAVHKSIYQCEPACTDPLRVVRPRLLAPGGAEPRPGIAVGDQGQQRLGERADVLGGHEQPVAVVVDDLGRPARAVEADHGEPLAHRLDEHDA